MILPGSITESSESDGSPPARETEFGMTAILVGTGTLVTGVLPPPDPGGKPGVFPRTFVDKSVMFDFGVLESKKKKTVYSFHYLHVRKIHDTRMTRLKKTRTEFGLS